MTLEELKKVKFHMVAHLSMAKEHQCTYADDSGRLGLCDITEKKNEFEFGESRRAYRIDSTWYDTKDEFVKALERFGFGPQLPVEGGEMKRNEQMMNAANAYAAGCYEGEPVSFSTEESMCETIADFCAGWKAAAKKACEWLEFNAIKYVEDADQLRESALLGDFRHFLLEGGE